MKPKQEKIIYPVQSSFKILKYTVPYFDMQYHYHQDYELVYIEKGSGLRYIGNSIHKFQDGDMVLIGPDLAHVWINYKKYHTEKPELRAEAVVLQFSGDLFSSMTDLPEFALIRALLQKARCGIHIVGPIRTRIAGYLEQCLESRGIGKIIQLLNILDTLSRKKELVLLNPQDCAAAAGYRDKRIDAVYHFVLSNFNRNICTRDAASVAHMEESAFCRFLKEKTRKTFTQLLNETRINHACQLLCETDLAVGQIAFECGFNTFANFYRQFKKYTGVTPGEYRK
ncbi:AraC family transcriptional regulator [bacterium]|nr:AraC family transcriptional regulator [bacterium]